MHIIRQGVCFFPLGQMLNNCWRALHCKQKIIRERIRNFLKTCILISVIQILYLGVSLSSSEKKIEVRIVKAWIALENEHWKLSLPSKIKVEFLRAIVNAVLLYRPVSRILSDILTKKLYSEIMYCAKNEHCGCHHYQERSKLSSSEQS